MTSALPISILTFGGGNAPPEDSIYFVNARMITATAGDDTTLELYCIDDMQPIDCGKALPTVIVVCKVYKESSHLVENRAFDLDIMQAASPNSTTSDALFACTTSLLDLPPA
ncbi:hypothetical protein EDB19DRAFT_2021256 [Suillus lakei]|nr:hypothetical protein EDB19DRAFT_2021256 [Suillus lakei]